ncbi:hypothetical protein [Paenibacillus sp. SI8]|uniref:hypothetical protein n=1 Tax=unclassified Paenibacillus TaxID=185978 RepID=UPI003466E6ED
MMQPIYPITEKSCFAHYNKPVLMFLNDGTEIYGVLSRVEKGKLILNEPPAAVASKTVKKTTKKTAKVKNKQSKAKSQVLEQPPASGEYPVFGIPPFGGFDYRQGALTFDIESVVALFS